MDRTAIEQGVRKVLAAQLGVATHGITPAHRLCEDLGVDSLDLVEIVMAIEDEFEIAITDEVAEGFKTVGQIDDYLASKVSA